MELAGQNAGEASNSAGCEPTLRLSLEDQCRRSWGVVPSHPMRCVEPTRLSICGYVAPLPQKPEVQYHLGMASTGV